MMLTCTSSSIILCVHLNCFFQVKAKQWNGSSKGGGCFRTLGIDFPEKLCTNTSLPQQTCMSL